jgi:hypothetical protein
MHIGILNTPRYRKTRNEQEIECLEARRKPNVKSTLNQSRHISKSSYLQSAYNTHKFQQKISVRQFNTCNFSKKNCGTFPYPSKQIPTKVNQFGVFSGGSDRMLTNF